MIILWIIGAVVIGLATPIPLENNEGIYKMAIPIDKKLVFSEFQEVMRNKDGDNNNTNLSSLTSTGNELHSVHTNGTFPPEIYPNFPNVNNVSNIHFTEMSTNTFESTPLNYNEDNFSTDGYKVNETLTDVYDIEEFEQNSLNISNLPDEIPSIYSNISKGTIRNYHANISESLENGNPNVSIGNFSYSEKFSREKEQSQFQNESDSLLLNSTSSGNINMTLDNSGSTRLTQLFGNNISYAKSVNFSKEIERKYENIETWNNSTTEWILNIPINLTIISNLSGSVLESIEQATHFQYEKFLGNKNLYQEFNCSGDKVASKQITNEFEAEIKNFQVEHNLQKLETLLRSYFPERACDLVAIDLTSHLFKWTDISLNTTVLCQPGHEHKLIKKIQSNDRILKEFQDHFQGVIQILTVKWRSTSKCRKKLTQLENRTSSADIAVYVLGASLLLSAIVVVVMFLKQKRQKHRNIDGTLTPESYQRYTLRGRHPVFMSPELTNSNRVTLATSNPAYEEDETIEPKAKHFTED